MAKHSRDAEELDIDEDKELSTECWNKFLRGTCFLFVMAGAMLSLSATLSCDFMTYNSGDSYNPKIEDLVISSVHNDVELNVTSGTIGMVRWNPSMLGCREFDPGPVGALFKTARVGAFTATICGWIALICIATEFLFCRFKCSRFLATFFLMFASAGQCLPFLSYATSYCWETTVIPYSCYYSTGSTLAIVAFVCYIISSALCFTTSKGKPRLRVLLEFDRRKSNTDPCCYCIDHYRDWKENQILKKKEEKEKKRQEELERKAEEELERQKRERELERMLIEEEEEERKRREEKESSEKLDEETNKKRTEDQNTDEEQQNCEEEVSLNASSKDVTGRHAPQVKPLSDCKQYSDVFASTRQTTVLRKAASGRKKSYANANVLDDDIFFDSK